MIWTGFLRCVFASIPNCLSTADLNSIPFDALKQKISNSANVPLCLRSLTFPISDIDGKSSNFCLPAISTKIFSSNAVMFCFSSARVAFWPVVCFVQRMEFNYEKRTKLAWCQANTPSDMLLITSHVQLFLLLGCVECWPNVSNGLHIPSIKSDRFWHCRLSLASIYSLGRWDKTQFSTLCEKCLCTRQYEFIICILLTFSLFSGKRRRWWTFLPASWSAWRAEEGRCVKPLNCDFSLFLSHFFVCCVNVWCCVF